LLFEEIANITNTDISGNTAIGGAGIENLDGILNLTNSTISNNTAHDPQGTFAEVGGGISNSLGIVTITNSTISGNHASLGGGISNDFDPGAGPVSLQNTILALNTASRFGQDRFGDIKTVGNNLIGDTTGNCRISLLPSDLTGDPGLGDFTDDGTPGNGHFPILAGSQVIDAANQDACPATDQLGSPRVGICDMGSVEFNGQIAVVIDVRPRSDANRINPNSSKSINLAIFSADGFDATTVDTSTVRFGATGIEAAPIHVAMRDVDGDGRRDLVLRFQIQDMAISCGDTSATLNGQTSSGLMIAGSTEIKTVQCRNLAKR
jgi:hypothetical protein